MLFYIEESGNGAILTFQAKRQLQVSVMDGWCLLKRWRKKRGARYAGSQVNIKRHNDFDCCFYYSGILLLKGANARRRCLRPFACLSVPASSSKRHDLQMKWPVSHVNRRPVGRSKGQNIKVMSLSVSCHCTCLEITSGYLV